MTYLAHLAGQLFNAPLLVEQGYLDVALSAIHDRLDIEPTVAAADLKNYERPARSIVIDESRGVAIVPVVGALDHRGGSISSMSGMASYTGLQAQLKDVARTRGVRGIVLDMDTPGGSVAGVVETAEFLKQLSAEMPVFAIANSLMASAGYWLASTATRVYAAPLATVGSIGVVTAHVDQSKAMERRGVAVTHIHAGARKVDGNPYGPLSDEARASIQGRIDNIYGSFVSTVARNRGLDEKAIRDTEAGVFDPAEALQLGLIDGIGTLADVTNALSSRFASPTTYSFSLSKDTSMTERLTHSQADIDAAVARAQADATASAQTASTTAISAAVAARTTEIAAAVATLAPANERLSAFFEALGEGVSPALSAKLAGRIPAPTAAVAVVSGDRNVEALFKAAAAGVELDATAEGSADPKAARKAELEAAGKSTLRLPRSLET